MGKVRKEIGVLKIVRAGGIVELYRHPIKAAQVMERYPRHCVTRPDVFKFPYIVVKPDSVLKPGQVFFIVPYHTIHRLLQSKGYRCHRDYIPDHHESVRKKAHEYGQPLMMRKKSSENTLDDHDHDHQMEEIDTSFYHQMIIPTVDENFRNKKQTNYHHDQRKVIPRAQQVADLSVEENGSFKDGDYDSDEAFVAAASACFPVKKKSSGGLVEVNKGIIDHCRKATATSLKPCLKKPQTNRKKSQQGPRVRFTLPDEDDDDEKWDTDFSDF